MELHLTYAHFSHSCSILWNDIRIAKYKAPHLCGIMYAAHRGKTRSQFSDIKTYLNQTADCLIAVYYGNNKQIDTFAVQCLKMINKIIFFPFTNSKRDARRRNEMC